MQLGLWPNHSKIQLLFQHAEIIYKTKKRQEVCIYIYIYILYMTGIKPIYKDQRLFSSVYDHFWKINLHYF